MKFDVIIGNPPYQDETSDTSYNPIYHLFMEESYKLAEKVEFITPARFLFNAGKTPKAWNRKVLNDEHIKVVYYEQDSSKVFPDTNIPGGIAITYRDVNKSFGEIGTFTQLPELNSILDKVTGETTFESIIDNIFPQNKFNLDVLYEDYPKYKNIIGSEGREKRITTSIIQQLDIFTEVPTTPDDVKIIGLINNKRVNRFIHPKYIEKHQNLHLYKIILPKSNGSGAIGEISNTPLIGTPIMGTPLIGYTQSFISIGSFETEFEGNAALKYIKTKFARTMLGTLKITQDNNKDTWLNVPLQDFTPNSDIDWSKSIAEIDQQLYGKYNLDEIERDFIENKLKTME
ncbi:Type II restriction endonuclease [Gracilibacillus halophilus YIM-C55.5]|uniref:Type II restriction endonuclease n=1 Tax=Gracilibacillus halophilus YIM-C55.5 TaxID=1308866 RepID=N4WKE7_9BACI|nr:Eco57I restriction-modification methylase domain-containing protein [Gracilibacillus halophilus]ENH96617.1 Type II restriction endonuclease [Gracilibacillus halophilus YIM-C55.5]